METSPEGTAENFGRPSGTPSIPPHDPALKRWAILTLSVRDKDVEFPKGIRTRPESGDYDYD